MKPMRHLILDKTARVTGDYVVFKDADSGEQFAVDGMTLASLQPVSAAKRGPRFENKALGPRR